MRNASTAGILGVLACIAFAAPRMASAQTSHRPLSAGDIDDIARLEMLEDYRSFDSTVLAPLLTAQHPEVRRRAAITIGRLADKRGLVLLLARPLDPDTAIAAAVVFAVGQIRDTSSIGWLDSLLSSPRTMPTVAAEAAISLGKIESAIAASNGRIRSTAARDALARFLTRATANARTNATIGEALLSIGRSGTRGDIAPIMKWSTAADEPVRWSATWALARLKNPAGVSALLVLAKDRSALVRSWAVRGLTGPVADSANSRANAEALLLAATHDADRTVRTEAIRTLGTYSDSAAVTLLEASLKSPDSWIATSAAEALGMIRSAATVPALVAATSAGRPCALREMARRSLQLFAQDTTRPALRALAHDPALVAVVDIAHDTVPFCRTNAIQTMRRLRDLPVARTPLRTAIDSILAAAPAAPPQQRPAAVPLTRTLDDYRQIVERWVVPDYNGKPRPTARWETARGAIDVELYAGDAPLAVDDFVHRMDLGTLVGTQFTRVVPDFVDQQETIRGGSRLRDEVNRHGLTRANLAWATAGLDTGNPGYTLGHTPQPHNEGNFTSLGRVIRGMDAVDRIQLGDWILSARMLTR